MQLAKATRLASYTKEQIMQLAHTSGYRGVVIDEILEVDVRELDVRYLVKFTNDGSFGDDPCTGNLFVKQVDLVVTLEF